MHTLYRVLLCTCLLTIPSCGKIDPNKQIDEGKVENNTYSSAEIGWTIKIPAHWEVISRAQNQQQQEVGAAVMEDAVGGEIDLTGFKNLIGFQKNKFNIFQSTSQPFVSEYEGEWEDTNAALKKMMYRAFQQQQIKIDSTATEIVQLDGLDFYTYQFRLFSPKGEVILTQLIYSRLMNGFDFGVTINYNNEADKNEMMTAWLNSKFN